ncbi:hypothetical protein BZA70DRAFT_274738 [Myxozyma melibiosi]|uniref:Uncharacterized protein n=1 Tax=Myxozyma melibiosi TaxID=54550 RepID=A0ABR1F9V9_9ASCO
MSGFSSPRTAPHMASSSRANIENHAPTRPTAPTRHAHSNSRGKSESQHSSSRATSDRALRPLQEQPNRDRTADYDEQQENVVRRSDSLSSLFSVFKSVSLSSSSSRRPNRESGLSVRSTSSNSSATVATVLGSSGSSRSNSGAFYQHSDKSTSSIAQLAVKTRSSKMESPSQQKLTSDRSKKQTGSPSDMLQRRLNMASEVMKRASNDQQQSQQQPYEPHVSQRSKPRDSDTASIASTASSRLRKFSQKFRRGSGFSSMSMEPVADSPSEEASSSSHKSHSKTHAKKSVKVKPTSALRHIGSSSQLSTKSKSHDEEHSWNDDLLRALYSVEDLTMMDKQPNQLHTSASSYNFRSATYQSQTLPQRRYPVQRPNHTVSPAATPAQAHTVRSVSDSSTASSYSAGTYDDSGSVSSSHTSPLSTGSYGARTRHSRSASLYSEKVTTASPIQSTPAVAPPTGGVCWIGENGQLSRAGYDLDDDSDDEYLDYRIHSRRLFKPSMSALPQARPPSGSIRSRASFDGNRYSGGSYGSSSMRSSGHDWRTDIEEEDTLRALAV